MLHCILVKILFFKSSCGFLCPLEGGICFCFGFYSIYPLYTKNCFFNVAYLTSKTVRHLIQCIILNYVYNNADENIFLALIRGTT